MCAGHSMVWAICHIVWYEMVVMYVTLCVCVCVCVRASEGGGVGGGACQYETGVSMCA